MSWISTAIRWVETKLEGLTEKVPPVIKNDLAVFFDTFAEAAYEAVKEEGPKALKGEVKLANAVATVLSKAAAAGWKEVAPTAAITLVQSVVTATRMNEGKPLVVPPPGVGSTPAEEEKPKK